MKIFLRKISLYYYLTKPGIIYGNVLTTFAGFFLGSQGHIRLSLLLSAIIGTALIIAAACICNNYMDRDIDRKMDRTKKRALVTGDISLRSAMIFATILGILGVLVLWKFTNVLTVCVGVIGFLDYVIFYGIGKRTTTLGTIIGSISGSMPIVAGYTAVTNRFDSGALVLFLILTLWQMPHFYAIGLYRLKDYTLAHLPILPVIKGAKITKIHMFLYIIGFVISLILLSVFHYAGYIYLVTMTFLGAIWLYIDIRGFWVKDTNKWARKMFFFSLILIMTLSLIIPIDTIVQHGILILW